jgi:hypothetical protein
MVCVGLVRALLLLFVSVLCALLLLLLLLFVGCVNVLVLGVWEGPLGKFVTGGSFFFVGVKILAFAAGGNSSICLVYCLSLLFAGVMPLLLLLLL